MPRYKKQPLVTGSQKDWHCPPREDKPAPVRKRKMNADDYHHLYTLTQRRKTTWNGISKGL